MKAFLIVFCLQFFYFTYLFPLSPRVFDFFSALKLLLMGVEGISESLVIPEILLAL